MKFIKIYVDKNSSEAKPLTRGVSDVGFPIFADADTDTDFAF